MSVTLAPDFAERAAAQRQYERARAENYHYYTGEYRPHLDRERETIPLGGDLGELIGPEVYMANHLSGLFDSPDVQPPVIFADIGGSLGISARRLAVYFRDAIEQSRMAIAVTDLSSSPVNFINVKKAPEIDHLNAAGGDKVRFISTPFSRLIRQSVTLQNGDVVPLKGRTHLLHDCYALTAWSQIPEVHIRQIGHLLAKVGGLYMVPFMNTIKPETMRGHNYTESQVQAIRLAHEALQKDFGLRLSERYIEDQIGVDYVQFHSAQAA